MDFSNTLPLDVLATQRRSSLPSDIPDIPDAAISDLISWVSAGPSHVRTYCKGMYKDYDFFEVTFPVARFGYLKEIDLNEYSCLVGRHSELPIPLPDNLDALALSTMLKMKGTLYDLGELFFTQLLHVLGLDDSVDLSDPHLWVCSSGDEHIMAGVGHSWRPDLKVVAPIDIVASPYFRLVEWG